MEDEDYQIGDTVIISDYAVIMADEDEEDKEYDTINLPTEVNIIDMDEEGIYFLSNSKNKLYVEFDFIFPNWIEYEIWYQTFHN